MFYLSLREHYSKKINNFKVRVWLKTFNSFLISVECYTFGFYMPVQLASYIIQRKEKHIFESELVATYTFRCMPWLIFTIYYENKKRYKILLYDVEFYVMPCFEIFYIRLGITINFTKNIWNIFHIHDQDIFIAVRNKRTCFSYLH